MSATPEAVIRTWFEELWNQGREETIDRLFAPDCVAYGLSGNEDQPLRGPEGFRPFFRRMHEAFPDLHITVVRTVTEGDMVAAHCHVTGHHLGEGLGVPATGKPVDFWGMGLGRIRNGQIVETWNCFDFLTFYQQLGWLPPLP